MSAYIVPTRRSFDALAAALDPSSLATIIENATVYPFVVTIGVQHTVRYEGGVEFTRFEQIRRIVQAPMRKPPEAEDYVPKGAKLVRADIFPATRFEDMPLRIRARYAYDYDAYLRWRKARSLSKEPDQLVPHVDYDPVMLEGQVWSWSTGKAP
jgi:hypothetical protein